MKLLGNALSEFVSGYGIWIIVGVLVAAFIVSVVFLILNIRKAKKINNVALSSEFESLKEDNPKLEIAEKIKDSSKLASPKEKLGKEGKSESLYSVSYDELKKDWIVKKKGASRASKRCKTEAEAIEFANKFSQSKIVKK